MRNSDNDGNPSDGVGTIDTTIILTPDEQLAFWAALDEPGQLSPAQIQLGRLMRGDTSSDES